MEANMEKVGSGVEVYSAKSGGAVQMTEAAQDHVRALMKGTHKVLRIDTSKSGCSGYSYVLDAADAPEADDHCCQIADDLSVYVSAVALPVVRGLRIDYVTEGLNATIKFDNPNATAHCGCGESFTVGDTSHDD